MRRQKNLQRAAGVTLSALLLAGAAASPAFAANVSVRHDLTAVLTLANDNLYRPSSIGGTYLGVNDDGLYEFEVTIPADFQSQPTPLEPDHYYPQHEISNPEVLGSRAHYYYGIHPGISDICLCGEKYILGAYKTLEEAIQARKQAEAQLHEPVLRAYQIWSSYVKIHNDWEKDHPLLFKVQRLGKIEFKMEFSGLPEGEDPSEGRQQAVEENGN